jgi:DNA-binding transcriptional ArsR family regulator
MAPFESLMGNTCNLRVIEYLLPMKNTKFNEKDLIEDIGVSKPTIIKAIRKFTEYELIKRVEQVGNSIYYKVNRASPFITLFEDVDNLIIQHLSGEEMVTLPKPPAWQNGVGSTVEMEKGEYMPPQTDWVIGKAVLDKVEETPQYAIIQTETLAGNQALAEVAT